LWLAEPPVGNVASQASRSSGWYRTKDPTLRNAGPRFNSRHLRSDATLMLSRFDTSFSVMRLTMISPLSGKPAQQPRLPNGAGERAELPLLSFRRSLAPPPLQWQEEFGTKEFEHFPPRNIGFIRADLYVCPGSER